MATWNKSLRSFTILRDEFRNQFIENPVPRFVFNTHFYIKYNDNVLYKPCNFKDIDVGTSNIDCCLAGFAIVSGIKEFEPVDQDITWSNYISRIFVSSRYYYVFDRMFGFDSHSIDDAQLKLDMLVQYMVELDFVNISDTERFELLDIWCENEINKQS